MAKYQFEIDGDKDPESIGVSFALFALSIFDDRFPGDEGHEQWKAAMTEVVGVINEHVRQAQEIAES